MGKQTKYMIAIHIVGFVSYILNIVIICINGASLFNNIAGWVCASLMVGNSLYQYLIRQRDCRWYKENNNYTNEYIAELKYEIMKMREKNENNSEERK